ncbi:MAG TPA: DUF1656 domain-containing protein [Candidatus Sulfotelmatobacter sp.]|jgi:hypothetical protein|nr:DUF1656 domain-containing protein [Candidatus Sulfotelmatobacter sp.]
MTPLREFDVMGIYFPPFLLQLLMACVPFFGLRWLAARTGLLFKLWNVGLVELSLFIFILSALVYS